MAPARPPRALAAAILFLSPIAIAQPATDAPPNAAAENQPTEDAPRQERSQPLLREGLFLVNAPGTVAEVDGKRVFITEPAPGQEPRTLTLVPSLKLSEFEQVLQARHDGRHRLSGRVLVYQGQNALLLTTFAVASGDAPAAEAINSDDQPTVGELLRTLEKQRRDRLMRESASIGRRGGGSEGPGGGGGDAPAKMRREGERIDMVRGRIVQNPTGWAIFAQFESAPPATTPSNDEDQPAPLYVQMLPCMMLEQLENLARYSPQPPEVTLSGELVAYKGRNYLLPTMYLVSPRVLPEATPGEAAAQATTGPGRGR